nr:dihydrofolate reductase family protein [Pedococcus sp. 5OH_020]
MQRLRYSAITSLDGYVADSTGRFDWARPTEELHRLVNDSEREVGTYLYGRRMFEVMRYWDAADESADRSSTSAEYRRIWQSADKVVYSATLTEVSTRRTRLVPRFDAEEVRRLKEESQADLSVGGPTLAAEAFRAGLVDELTLYLTPVNVGGGTAALPADVPLELHLLEQRTVGGVAMLRYAVRSSAA